MFGLSNEQIINLGLLGLGIYFSVQLMRGFLGYARFRRLRRTAVLTWPVPKPPHFGFLIFLGVTGLVLTAVNGYLARPLHHLYGLGVMALYFLLMVPLARTIQLGLYRDGVWADAGFLPYGKIARMRFHEGPSIVLLLVPRGRSAPFHLPVPPAEYGAVRKLLQEKIRTQVVRLDEAILGLN
jgi:hypothetical protein